jgi:hypothetical protein
MIGVNQENTIFLNNVAENSRIKSYNKNRLDNGKKNI